jgi:hypothetical protein
MQVKATSVLSSRVNRYATGHAGMSLAEVSALTDIHQVVRPEPIDRYTRGH